MKHCPFCKKKIDPDHPAYGVQYNKLCNKWIFDHYCHISEDDLDIVVTVYGNTKEEVIERWNNRAKVQTSESL